MIILRVFMVYIKIDFDKDINIFVPLPLVII